MQSSIHLMIVGAFPKEDLSIVGGIATSCRVLVNSSLSSRARLTLIDSSQTSNPAPKLWKRALRAFVRGALFIFMFERARPQVVVLFSSPGASSIEKGVLAWYACLRGKAAILMPRGAPPARSESVVTNRVLRALTFGGATRIVCQGDAWHRFAVTSLGFSEQNAPIVPNWTATPELLAIGRERLPSAKSSAALLYLGWVEREKGILDLLSACERLKDELDFRLDIVGDGSAMPEVVAWIERNSMTERVICHGWLHGGVKLERLRRANIFALPSWAEGLPNAMIEAMACRLACVVSAVGNIPSTIGQSGAVLMIPARDTEKLTDALRLVIIDNNARQKIADTGYTLASNCFDVEKAVIRLLDIARSTI